MEITTGFVQQTTPVGVRFVGDTADVPIDAKNATYSPTVGDKVLLAKSGSDDGWVIVCQLGTT